MRKATRKFPLILALCDIAFVLIAAGFAFLYIGESGERRRLFGEGTGRFIVFSNAAAGIVYYLLKRKKD